MKGPQAAVCLSAGCTACLCRVLTARMAIRMPGLRVRRAGPLEPGQPAAGEGDSRCARSEAATAAAAAAAARRLVC